ncbi:MAG: dihydroorotase [Candidatus Margulisbacteria bacterium]|nr:dihydroorotase [Candidatus Margulisiibacteriota bacterium]
MTKLLIKGGRVIDPAANLDGIRDVLIENGKIKSIGPRVKGQGARIIDAKGLLVLPGLIDLHTHLRDPGRPDKETIYSGSRAAALGGFTTICCMANTSPPIDNPAVVEYIIAKAKAESIVNILPIAAITKGLKGEEMAEMGRCFGEGAVAFSDDGRPVMRADVMRRALEYASQFGVPVISHCEDLNLSMEGSMNEGAVSTEIGLPGIPALSEEVMVARDILLAREFGRVHVAHVSSAKSVKLIRQAKREGVKVSCETCPHYFTLTEEAVKEYDTNAKVNPPLKTKADVKEIMRGLKDGTIDAIATDHAPHTIEDKNVEFNLAASGLVGLETGFGLVYTNLVDKKIMTLKQAVAKMTASPARILSLANKGALKPGADADVTIIDPKQEWLVDPAKFASKSRNTPFAGWQLKGKVLYTIVAGRVVVKDGKLAV